MIHYKVHIGFHLIFEVNCCAVSFQIWQARECRLYSNLCLAHVPLYSRISSGASGNVGSCMTGSLSMFFEPNRECLHLLDGLLTSCPRKWIWVAPNTHFGLLSVRPDLLIRVRTAVRRASRSSFVFPAIRTLSMRHTTPSISWSVSITHSSLEVLRT